MSYNNNNTYNNITIEHVENLDPRYKDVPMDLNSSPLQDYFEQFRILNNNAMETAAPQSKISSNNTIKTMPVLIPGSSEYNNSHERKKKHHKRRRKPISHTFPDEGLEVVRERKLQQQAPTSSGSNMKGKSSQSFIVGSLQEKAPVPWPSTLTTAPDIKRHRLKNRQTVNWPLIPEDHSRRYRTLNEDEDNIFNMDSDYYNSSDFDEEDDFILG